jgi:hypothetical protein
VVFVPRDFMDGRFVYAQMVVNLFNYPFWLFWVAIIGNMLFAIMLQRKKDKAAGLEQHKQLQRAKEMKRKQKRQVSLPTKHTKKK